MDRKSGIIKKEALVLLGLLEPLAPVDVYLLLTHFLNFRNMTHQHKTSCLYFARDKYHDW